MTTSTASTIFAQLAALAGEDVFQNVLPVVGATLTSIETNPAQWTNPASAMLLGNKFLVDVLGTLPTMEASAVTGAAQFVGAFLTAATAKLQAAGTALTPASVGTEAGTALVGAVPGSIAAS